MDDPTADGAARQGYFLEDMNIGMSAELARTVGAADILMFAGVSGDTNPVHLDEEFAKTTIFEGRVAHGMLAAGYLSAIFGTKLPGPGAIYLSQSLKFTAPVRIGDTVLARVEVTEIDAKRGRVRFDCQCSVAGKAVLKGEAELLVPRIDNRT